MPSSFTPQLKSLLVANGCLFVTQRRFVVDGHIKSRHTANAVLKQAGVAPQF